MRGVNRKKSHFSQEGDSRVVERERDSLDAEQY